METKTHFGAWRVKVRFRRIMKIAVIITLRFSLNCSSQKKKKQGCEDFAFSQQVSLTHLVKAQPQQHLQIN